MTIMVDANASEVLKQVEPKIEHYVEVRSKNTQIARDHLKKFRTLRGKPLEDAKIERIAKGYGNIGYIFALSRIAERARFAASELGTGTVKLAQYELVYVTQTPNVNFREESLKANWPINPSLWQRILAWFNRNG